MKNKQQTLFVPCYIRHTLLQVLQVFTFVVPLKKDKFKEKMCSYGFGRVGISFRTRQVITQLPCKGNKWSLYQTEGQELCPQVITTRFGSWLREETQTGLLGFSSVNSAGEWLRRRPGDWRSAGKPNLLQVWRWFPTEEKVEGQGRSTTFLREKPRVRQTRPICFPCFVSSVCALIRHDHSPGYFS